MSPPDRVLNGAESPSNDARAPDQPSVDGQNNFYL